MRGVACCYRKRLGCVIVTRLFVSCENRLLHCVTFLTLSSLQAAELARIGGQNAGEMAIAVYQRMITPRLAHSMNLTGQNSKGNLMDSTIIKVVRGTQTLVLFDGCMLTGVTRRMILCKLSAV